MKEIYMKETLDDVKEVFSIEHAWKNDTHKIIKASNIFIDYCDKKNYTINFTAFKTRVDLRREILYEENDISEEKETDKNFYKKNKLYILELKEALKRSVSCRLSCIEIYSKWKREVYEDRKIQFLEQFDIERILPKDAEDISLISALEIFLYSWNPIKDKKVKKYWFERMEEVYRMDILITKCTFSMIFIILSGVKGFNIARKNIKILSQENNLYLHSGIQEWNFILLTYEDFLADNKEGVKEELLLFFLFAYISVEGTFCDYKIIRLLRMHYRESLNQNCKYGIYKIACVITKRLQIHHQDLKYIFANIIETVFFKSSFSRKGFPYNECHVTFLPDQYFIIHSFCFYCKYQMEEKFYSSLVDIEDEYLKRYLIKTIVKNSESITNYLALFQKFHLISELFVASISDLEVIEINRLLRKSFIRQSVEKLISVGYISAEKNKYEEAYIYFTKWNYIANELINIINDKKVASLPVVLLDFSELFTFFFYDIQENFYNNCRKLYDAYVQFKNRMKIILSCIDYKMLSDNKKTYYYVYMRQNMYNESFSISSRIIERLLVFYQKFGLSVTNMYIFLDLLAQYPYNIEIYDKLTRLVEIDQLRSKVLNILVKYTRNIDSPITDLKIEEYANLLSRYPCKETRYILKRLKQELNKSCDVLAITDDLSQLSTIEDIESTDLGNLKDTKDTSKKRRFKTNNISFCIEGSKEYLEEFNFGVTNIKTNNLNDHLTLESHINKTKDIFSVQDCGIYNEGQSHIFDIDKDSKLYYEHTYDVTKNKKISIQSSHTIKRKVYSSKEAANDCLDKSSSLDEEEVHNESNFYLPKQEMIIDANYESFKNHDNKRFIKSEDTFIRDEDENKAFNTNQPSTANIKASQFNEETIAEDLSSSDNQKQILPLVSSNNLLTKDNYEMIEDNKNRNHEIYHKNIGQDKQTIVQTSLSPSKLIQEKDNNHKQTINIENIELKKDKDKEDESNHSLINTSNSEFEDCDDICEISHITPNFVKKMALNSKKTGVFIPLKNRSMKITQSTNEGVNTQRQQLSYSSQNNINKKIKINRQIGAEELKLTSKSLEQSITNNAALNKKQMSVFSPYEFSAQNLLPPRKKDLENLIVFDINRFYSLILSKDLNTKLEEKPQVTNFENIKEYYEYFEPLIINEIKAQINKKVMDASTFKLEPLVLISESQHQGVIDCTFTCTLALEYQENDCIYLSQSDGEQKNNRIGILKNMITTNDKTFLTITMLGKSNVKSALTYHHQFLLSLKIFLKEYKSIFYLEKFRYARQILDPIKKDIKPHYDHKDLEGLMSLFRLNLYQTIALKSCMDPLNDIVLIQGPSGTGKSTTIVSIISAFVSNKIDLGRIEGKSRILICAPSNNAIDEIARRVVSGVKTFEGKTVFPKIIRMGIHSSVSNELKSITLESLLSCCENKTQAEKNALKNQLLLDSDIICTTLAGSVYETLFSISLNFDLIIIDESTQSVELSSILPLKHNPKKVVLVGDPKQLPPTIISSSYKYETSLFQRLSNKMFYTFLKRQYRMIKKIAEFPSFMFYHSLLETDNSCAKRTNPFFKFVNGAVFVNVKGSEVGNSINGYSNPEEIKCVIKLVSGIYKQTAFNNNVAIISPYKMQVNNILASLGSNAALRRAVDVNTVDAFQGQEKDLVIFSAVRTDKIGFINDCRRMNVALTRARFGLVIFGNKEHLRTDKIWNSLIEFYEKDKCLYEEKQFFADFNKKFAKKYNNRNK